LFQDHAHHQIKREVKRDQERETQTNKLNGKERRVQKRERESSREREVKRERSRERERESSRERSREREFKREFKRERSNMRKRDAGDGRRSFEIKGKGEESGGFPDDADDISTTFVKVKEGNVPKSFPQLLEITFNGIKAHKRSTL